MSLKTSENKTKWLKFDIKMGKTFVRGKEKYSLVEKKKVGDLVEK